MKDSVKSYAKRTLFPIPRHLQENVINTSPSALEDVEKSLHHNYYTGWRGSNNYTPQAFEADFGDHLTRRLEGSRRLVVPWLDSARPLPGLRILEIGCGTGSSTVALAEQGAKVTGVDIDDGALVVAQDRVKAYGVEASFRSMNADQLIETFEPGSFDSIIFFASLEHMTLSERLKSLHDAWWTLPAGGLLVIVETPNRLWWFDDHTARMPFFHWLPDELAFDQSRNSTRENFRELYREWNLESAEQFLRRGRGISFHEIDAAIAPIDDVRVVSSFSSFWGIRYSFGQSTIDRRYKALLMKMRPGLHQGFFDKDLFIVLEKTDSGKANRGLDPSTDPE